MTAPTAVPTRGRERFRHLDAYRVEREWRRYEGTAQRDLFRQLRVRFLLRHSIPGGVALDVGPGPGRFTPFVGRAAARRVVLELSDAMLLSLRGRWGHDRSRPIPDLVRGDAVVAPFQPASCREVVALGNPIGFAGADASRLLDRLIDLVAPGGTLLVETVSGPGERSRYLSRLPPGTVARLFRSPLSLLRKRIESEGFERAPDRDPDRHGFRRITLQELAGSLAARGVAIVEAVAVAPALGRMPERIRAVAADPKAWARLLELEEELGRQPERGDAAVSLLVAGTRGPANPGEFRPPSDGTRGRRKRGS